MPKHIGFTGTQAGMTSMQRAKVLWVMQRLGTSASAIGHHGDCVGADADFARLLHLLHWRIVVHPPRNSSKRAYTLGDTMRDPLPYLTRNHRIVDECEVLIATPKGREEELRSGTWATVRYARRKGKRIIMVYPNGDLGE